MGGEEEVIDNLVHLSFVLLPFIGNSGIALPNFLRPRLRTKGCNSILCDSFCRVLYEKEQS